MTSITQVNSEFVLRYTAELCALQSALLYAWTFQNPESKDYDMLLDFPKECSVAFDGNWLARRHGTGVRFLSEKGVCVDVPFSVDQPDKIDPDRLYDYVASLGLFASERSAKPRRLVFYDIFDELEASGRLITLLDSTGRKLYTIGVDT